MGAENATEISVERLRELETANRLKAEFLANVSHELRTPIHAIIGYTELLVDGVYGQLSDEQEQTVHFIGDSARDLHSLVTNLLDLTKIESGRVDLILQSFDLRDLVGELLSQLKPLADVKHVTLESRVLADITRVRTDRGKLKQVLTNLVGNALKFTDSGRVAVIVDRGAATDSSGTSTETLRITVRDTGIGIPADRLEKIFDRFYQVDASANRVHQGAGLGLYITKQLLELISGTISVESSVGQGTTVTVALPRNYEEIKGIQQLRRRIADAGATNNQEGDGGRVVLVITDNPDVARILSDGLGAADYKVQVTSIGSEAVELARRIRPMVILLNAETSSFELWSLFQEIKSHPETKDTPTIFLGGSSAHDLGAPLTVAAPLTRREVLRSIRAVSNANKKKLLIVDDDESFRDILKCALAEEGYRIGEAANGKEAIEKLGELKPDLVLLDLNIPEIDGWGVMRYMSSHPQFQNVEVLIISGDASAAREVEAIKSKTSGFICKADFKVGTVLEKVADLLEVGA